MWILFFTAVILHVRFPTARIVAFLILITHALGASTWLIRQPYGWLWCFGVWLLARCLFDLFWNGPGRECGMCKRDAVR
ncbi:MAG: hypothetical protein HQ582_26580 [Planctomycetes bacterium]|nr:hypothetical protein [Planctomycetota bacterium]